MGAYDPRGEDGRQVVAIVEWSQNGEMQYRRIRDTKVGDYESTWMDPAVPRGTKARIWVHIDEIGHSDKHGVWIIP